MKFYLAQLNPIVGNIEYNFDKICSTLADTAHLNYDMIVFSECVLTGYPTGDLLNYSEFIDQVETALNQLKQESFKYPDKAIVIGTPFKLDDDLYNSVLVFLNGDIVFTQHKTLLPNYDVFDERRYFKQNTVFKPFQFKGHLIGLTICEDVWTDNVTGHSRYAQNPLHMLAKQSLDIIINIAASPFEIDKLHHRLSLFSQQAMQLKLPFIVVNQVGANDQLIFDGGSFVLDAKGNHVAQLATFIEDGLLIDLADIMDGRQVFSDQFSEYSSIQRVYHALILGIKDYFIKTGFKRAVIGLSGGIDSAVVGALASLALGSEHVYGVSMPSSFSSQGSLDDAKQLAENCNMTYSVIPIDAAFEQFKQDLAGPFQGLKPDVTEENIQSRIRGVLLMALSNKRNALVLSTGNKSELAMGYCTLYGDMCGALSVIADLPKTMVYQLAEYINERFDLIPQESITKPPSAELRPGQLDSDSLPPYAQLDRIIYLYIEESKSTQDIVKLGFDATLVEDVVKKININEYKRQQGAPVLRVTSKAFGIGRRMPIAAKYSF